MVLYSKNRVMILMIMNWIASYVYEVFCKVHQEINFPTLVK